MAEQFLDISPQFRIALAGLIEIGRALGQVFDVQGGPEDRTFIHRQAVLHLT
jgi:hypothetical protein